MARVLLIHWKEAELPPRVARLKKAGHSVATHATTDGKELKGVNADPPDAILIDLSRLPSHGRTVGWVFRQQKSTRHVPLVFIEGDPPKVERIKTDLPDAVFTTWNGIPSALKKALSNKPANPVVPKSKSGYSGTPLPKKLGVDKAESLALIDAPKGFETLIGSGNTRTEIRRGGRRPADLVIWFVKTGTKFRAGLKKAKAAMADGGAIWIAWPKKSSDVASDLSEGVVRTTALAAGLVDYKVCAIDATWSGLKFARRKKA